MENLAGYIEHTVLFPGATADDIRKACDEVREYGFYGICANSCYTSLCAHLLAGSGAKVIAVCAFPLGCVKSGVKALEARLAAQDRANEIDMVMNMAAAKNGAWDAVADDIRAVAEASGLPVKVIIETNLLSDAEKIQACLAAVEAGAAFVKTCTGMNGGVRVEDVTLIKETLAGRAGIKASGGIRSHAQAAELIRAGAARIGASAGPLLLAAK